VAVVEVAVVWEDLGGRRQLN